MYEKYLKTTESSRWPLDSCINWNKVKLNNSDLATLRLLEQAAYIESYAPVFVSKGLSSWWETVDESAIFSIQFYDEYKHFYALRKYLSTCGIPIPDKKVVSLRSNFRKNRKVQPYRYLANYMISEHYTAHFYMRLVEIIEEPNLKQLITLIMQDEFRHCNIFYDLLDKHQKTDKKAVFDAVMDEANDFHHFGEEVVGEDMPIVVSNDIEVMLGLNRKIESLLGTSIIEYKRSLL